MLPSSRRGWTWRTWAVGAAYAATVVLFVLANKQTTSANTIFLQSAAPLYVLLAGIFLLHERVRLADIGVMVVLLARPGPLRDRHRRRGRDGAEPGARQRRSRIASGVTWAATLLGLRWLARDGESSDGRGGRDRGQPARVRRAACPFALPPSGDGGTGC